MRAPRACVPIQRPGVAPQVQPGQRPARRHQHRSAARAVLASSRPHHAHQGTAAPQPAAPVRGGWGGGQGAAQDCRPAASRLTSRRPGWHAGVQQQPRLHTRDGACQHVSCSTRCSARGWLLAPWQAPSIPPAPPPPPRAAPDNPDRACSAPQDAPDAADVTTTLKRVDVASLRACAGDMVRHGAALHDALAAEGVVGEARARALDCQPAALQVEASIAEAAAQVREPSRGGGRSSPRLKLLRASSASASWVPRLPVGQRVHIGQRPQPPAVGPAPHPHRWRTPCTS